MICQEERRLAEFAGSQGIRERSLRVLQGYRRTKDFKKSTAGNAYCAEPCIKGRKFPAEMHGHAFQPSTICTTSLTSARLRELVQFQTVLGHAFFSFESTFPKTFLGFSREIFKECILQSHWWIKSCSTVVL